MLPGLLGGAPVRAALVIYEPPTARGNTPGRERDRLQLQFNPTQVTLAKSANWDRSRAPSDEAATFPEFISAQPRSMTVEVFVDAAVGRGPGVQQQVETLLACCAPRPHRGRAGAKSAPWVRLQWGASRTTAFYAVVTSVGVTYTRFARDGTPLRALCSVRLEEAGGATPAQNPTSAAAGPVDAHQVVAGESLATLAWRTYGDPTRWRAIAEANDIDDPDRVVPGTHVVLPVLAEEPVEEPRG
ncbi:LysM peptidoglycan-binding domain-containing protein [Streptomyces palmae]|uniref:LysM peptidoglycan-binding domain-containing protein n=1 Tax=Streptomyces palmae TaxID=1701085 RepID=A0A4Z0HC02_9ACTN|nr:LysM peptidoglycan-binding domain-containing protein [Streptomyces palmae]TGB10019.1 LysM peptidoglycan-binding domain-containing protein [Streptomyces palmae]